VDDYEEEERKAKEEAHEKMSQRFMEYAARWKLISEQEAAAKAAAAAIEAAKPPLGVAAAKKAARKAQKKVDAKELALAREARFEQTKILCAQQAREYEMAMAERNKEIQREVAIRVAVENELVRRGYCGTSGFTGSSDFGGGGGSGSTTTRSGSGSTTTRSGSGSNAGVVACFMAGT
jgi:membrane protein involved in colicin uptake